VHYYRNLSLHLALDTLDYSTESYLFICRVDYQTTIEIPTNYKMSEPTGVSMIIGAHTKLIISTSGRLSSLQRYQRLLQKLLKLDIAYVPIHSGDESAPAIDPQRFIWALKGMATIGGAISRDIKHAVIPYLDELDETARSVQSVNTVIVKPGGKLIGYNTDVLGFKIAIENGMQQSGISVSTAVCYGYGGVASVVVSVLQSLGIIVYIIGRSHQSAAVRAQELGVQVWTGEPVDLFVNATPASEKPLDQAANFIEALGFAKIAFDHEMPGRYMKQFCEEKGIFHINGTDMYYPQMRTQWTLFLNGLVDNSEISRLLEEADVA
jgi:shikimate dehydrogenase